MHENNVAQMGQPDVKMDDAMLARVAMSGPGMTVVVRCTDTLIVASNKPFKEYAGVEDGQHNFTDFIDEYHYARLQRLFDESKEKPRAYPFCIFSIRDRSGTTHPYYVYVSEVEASEPDEPCYYHILMLPDRSERGMPFATFDAKELFLEHFEAEDFGTFEWLLEPDKVYWSPGIYDIYEVDPAVTDLGNFYARQFLNPLDQERAVATTRKSLETGQPLNLEFRIITAKGNHKIVHSLGRLVRDSSGKAIKFVGSLRDVTMQRHIEDDLKSKVEELHRSNRELEAFAYAASHDMLEPLRKITTFSDRLTEKYGDVLEGDGAMYLGRMINSAENMRMLINSLLEFSKVAKSSAPFEEVDLNTIIAEVRTELELKMEETSTSLICEQLPTIEAIRSQMKQLFVNLINNAIKFHKEGVAPEIVIKVGLATDDEVRQYGLRRNMKYYRLLVCDNGIGFEREYAQRIFHMFQRLHGKSEYPGSGIGLAICKKIAEYHDGAISAESSPGNGSTFILYLPEKQ